MSSKVIWTASRPRNPRYRSIALARGASLRDTVERARHSRRGCRVNLRAEGDAADNFQPTARCYDFIVPPGLTPKARPLAEPLPLDGISMVVQNFASLSRAAPEWQALVSGAEASCRRLFGEQFVALYVRGSVPQGAAVAGLSDLDCILYLWEPRGARDSLSQRAAAADAARRALRAEAEALRLGNPVCSKVEFKLFFLPEGGRVADLLEGVSRGDEPVETVSHIPGRFEIKALSALAAGADVAALLPETAAAPVPVVLPYLAEDILSAAESTRDSSENTDFTRIALWCLKRVLRAAFEAVQEEVSVYTRDLYWCCVIACKYSPNLQNYLADVLNSYLRIAEGGVPNSVARESIAVAEEAAVQVLRTHWSRLLEQGNGEVSRGISSLSLEDFVRDPSKGLKCQLEEGWKRKLAAKTAWLVDFEGRLSGAEVGRTSIPGSSRPVREIQGTGELDVFLEHHSELTEPVLLRGAVSHWPAVDKWNLSYLASRPGFGGKVRVALGLEFPFCEPTLHEVLVTLLGPEAAPSNVVDMSAAEFAFRLAGLPGLRPIVYPEEERYYMQADLTRDLLRDLDLFGNPFNSIARLVNSYPSKGRISADSWEWGQEPRAWISVAGSISPTHYDSSPSLLVQVRGRKQMVFWEPRDLQKLGAFPATHLMRRRCRILPECSRTTEAILGPGDVVFFPPRWAHYTKSLTLSTSVTARFKRQSQW